MLLWTTQWLGFLNELYSRPVIHVDKTEYSYPVGRLGFVQKPDYRKNPNALHLISQSQWEGERPLRDNDGKPVATSFDYLHAQRVSNFLRRQIPYFLGCFPFMTYIIIIVYHLEYQKWRLREDNDGDLEIPSWVNLALYGTIFLFSSFAFVMPIYQVRFDHFQSTHIQNTHPLLLRFVQYLPPSYYWGSEVVYCLLSLSAKLWLGLLILVNVIMNEARAEDLLGASGLQRMGT